MGIYVYRATDKQGKVTNGKIEARDEMEASVQIAKLGLTPISIGFQGEKAPPFFDKWFKKGAKRASGKALIVFSRQFATIVKAAVPILEGLSVLGDQTEDPNLKEALTHVIHDVEEGAHLSEAMAKHPGVFSDLYVNTIVAGEAGGVLDKLLLRLASVMEEEEETRNSIKSAMQYPIMVTIAMFIAIIVLSVFVMPQFIKVYAGMNMALPLPTQIMILISNALRNYWYISFPVIVSIPIGFKIFINMPLGRKYWDRFKFEAPVMGEIYKKIVMLRFATMLNVLYQAGLPILRILDIVKITIGNVILSEHIEIIKHDVADGKGVAGGVLNCKLFPRLVGYMIAIGEKTGALTSMLDSLCEYYSSEVRTSMKGLTALIEPLMTAVMGTVILGMALAIFMPMWNLISVVRQAG